MASTFFGLNIATSGIYAAQAGLTTTLHNVANENTKGYSRQQISQKASDALRFYASYGMVGSGVSVSEVTQVRDAYYDDKYRYNEGKLGEYSSKYSYELQIEDYFNEFETDGFIVEYEELFSTLKSMQGNPAELTYRTEFLSCCQTIADYFNDIQTKLTNLQQEANTEVSNLVDRINTISAQIASLTKQINTVEITGAVANDLRDSRELLLDELSEIIPIDVTEVVTNSGNTEFSVKVQGVTLVDTYDSVELYTVERDNPQNSMDSPGLYDIYFMGTKLDVQAMGLSGTLRASLDVRDGNNGTIDTTNPNCEAVAYKGIPHYVNKLQGFKQTIADLFNDIHQNNTVKDADGNDVPGNYNLYGQTTEDIPIFIMSDNGVLSVNKKLVDDPSLLATSEYPIHDGKEESGIVTKLLELQNIPAFDNYTASEYLHSIVSEISVDVKKAKTFEENYTNIQQSISNQKLSVSGVDGDEESMNLVKYQEAFELSSKMISVMQEMYDKLINEMGV